MGNSEKRLGFWSLICLVIGTIIGGGAFALPQNISAHAETAAVLLAWLITSIGIMGLVFVFVQLNKIKPGIHGGIYAYAKAGFGDFIGFNSAWGYWVSAWLGNVSYAVLMFSALGFFFPVFGEGNTLPAIACASVLLWSVHLLLLRGLKEAALVNIVTTVAKIIPIIVFVICCLLAFNWQKFSFNFWGDGLGSVFTQLKSTMLVTLWVFIGIEGAVVVSARAKKSSDVAKATIWGLVATLSIYVLISVLSLGIVSQPGLAAMKNPSMAYVLESIVGRWGAVLINLGLVVSLVGAWLGWTLLCAELPNVAAKDKVMPRFMAFENKNQSPAGSLWLTNGLIQLFLVLVLFSQSTYLALLQLATSCILLPYFFSALYALKLIFTDNYYRQYPQQKLKNLIIALVGCGYGVLLVLMAGPKLLLFSSILYAVGIAFYLWAKWEAKQKPFKPYEAAIALVIVLCAIAALWIRFT